MLRPYGLTCTYPSQGPLQGERGQDSRVRGDGGAGVQGIEKTGVSFAG